MVLVDMEASILKLFAVKVSFLISDRYVLCAAS